MRVAYIFALDPFNHDDTLQKNHISSKRFFNYERKHYISHHSSLLHYLTFIGFSTHHQNHSLTFFLAVKKTSL